MKSQAKINLISNQSNRRSATVRNIKVSIRYNIGKTRRCAFCLRRGACDEKGRTDFRLLRMSQQSTHVHRNRMKTTSQSRKHSLIIPLYLRYSYLHRQNRNYLASQRAYPPSRRRCPSPTFPSPISKPLSTIPLPPTIVVPRNLPSRYLPFSHHNPRFLNIVVPRIPCSFLYQ